MQLPSWMPESGITGCTIKRVQSGESELHSASVVTLRAETVREPSQSSAKHDDRACESVVLVLVCDLVTWSAVAGEEAIGRRLRQ